MSVTAQSSFPGSPPVVIGDRDRLPQWWLVICLTALMILAQIDKYTLSLLVGPIKADLKLGDAQVSLIIGAAFALANIVASAPAGWLADRISRRGIVQSGVLIWSIMGTMCGGALSFAQLFMARAGVGFGEGLFPPACYSLIRDGVDEQRRGRAFAVFSSANSFGAGLSLIVGGLIIGFAYHSGIASVPWFGAVKPWQLTLMLVGLIGLPISFLAWAFRDPGRPPASSDSDASVRQAWAEAKRNAPLYLPLLGFGVAHACIATGFGVWMPAFVGRRWGLTPQEIGPTLGLMLMVCAPIGLGAVGYIIDRFGRDSLGKCASLSIWLAVILAVAAALLPYAPSLTLYWVCQGGVVLSSTAYLAIASTLVSRTADARSIGKILSIFLLIFGLTGAGLAPLMVGALSDRVFAGADGSLGSALAVLGILFGLLGLVSALLLWRAATRADAAVLRSQS
jgi:MFS transporter, Spinster family, sphingosine-1-phosphate transporter